MLKTPSPSHDSSTKGGSLRYIDDMYAPPLTVEQINVLKKLKKGLLIKEMDVTRHFINKALNGGRLPHSVHKKFLQYLQKIKES